ncbi:MAG: hypothetical protein JWL59_4603 [Chthoniobacteraceae bacterium]|nr:hypothetical protein [Chthoniobacteraceae bacterium]
MFSPKLVFAVVSAASFASTLFAGVELKEEAGKVRVEIDGKLFTEYCFTGAPHVYFYPIIGPDGAKMTRAWPMENAPGEEHDHPHHRSLWFAHGAVNGIDFWSEAASHKTPPATAPGQIVHDKFLEIKSGEKEGVLSDLLKWVAPDGSIPITSVQTVRFHGGPEAERILDFQMVLTAGEKDVLFGDTKEGTMAIRIAESMRLAQPKNQSGQGHIVNGTGETDDKVWGKRAAWVDMSGPVDGKTVGIAMFENPKNFRTQTRWHARDYGLFAANPFCEVEMDKTQPKGAGDFKLAAGKSVTLSYRIYIHQGDAVQAKIAEHYNKYSAADNGSAREVK